MPKKRRQKRKKRKTRSKLIKPRWTKEEIKDLKKIYKNVSNDQLAKLFGRKRSSIVSKASRLGLRKSAIYLRLMGRRCIAVRHHGSKMAG